MPSPAEPVSEAAPAKLNPVLRVLGRRDDGFHQIETLVLPLTLSDSVVASPGPNLSLTVMGKHASLVPPGKDNLVLRAAGELRAEVRGDGARLALTKRIPVAAGLGGGSADAAATLRALERLWGARVGVDGLVEIAARVGSDVPALVHRRPVIARGRGEIVEPFDVPPTSWVLRPLHFGVGAAEAYRWWDEDGGATGPDPEALLEALAAGDVERAGALLSNDLEDHVTARRPAVLQALRRLRDAGPLGTVLCGSGPTIAGLCRDERHAHEIARQVGGIAVTSIA